MLPCSSSSLYCVYVISLACSARAPDSWMSTSGISRMRIQKESVLEKRPQLNSFLFFGGMETGITADSLCTECDGNLRRDPTHTPQGTRLVHRTQGTASDIEAPTSGACEAGRKSRGIADSV